MWKIWFDNDSFIFRFHKVSIENQTMFRNMTNGRFREMSICVGKKQPSYSYSSNKCFDGIREMVLIPLGQIEMK